MEEPATPHVTLFPPPVFHMGSILVLRFRTAASPACTVAVGCLRAREWLTDLRRGTLRRFPARPPPSRFSARTRHWNSSAPWVFSRQTQLGWSWRRSGSLGDSSRKRWAVLRSRWIFCLVFSFLVAQPSCLGHVSNVPSTTFPPLPCTSSLHPPHLSSTPPPLPPAVLRQVG